jgi:transposase
VEAAHGAVRKKESSYGSPYRRMAARRGKKKALLAVAHSLAIAIYPMLKFKTASRELGADFFDKLNPRKLLHPLTTRIENLGYQVQITPISQAA